MSIKFILASTAALALVAGSPAFAARAQSEQASAAGTDNAAGDSGKAKGERKTCRTFIGSDSRMKRDRLCLTRAEWKKFEATQTE
ncbi:MAG: hypothetical protein ACJ8ER_03815 [Allosphingosinicella sp.]